MSAEMVQSVDVIRAEVAPVVARATALVIRTPEEYTGAAQGLKEIKAALVKVDAFFDPTIASAHATWKANLAQKALIADPLKQAEAIVKGKQVAWFEAQEKARKAEEARLNAIEQERARKEREREEAAARLLREKEAAAQREAEEARRRAAAASSAKERERLQREAEARQKEATAAAAKAEAREDAAASVQASTVSVASAAPVVKGQSIATVWRARVVDPRAAATALLAFPDWAAYLEISQGQLDKFAGRTKGAVPIAGVEWYEASRLSSTSK